MCNRMGTCGQLAYIGSANAAFIPGGDKAEGEMRRKEDWNVRVLLWIERIGSTVKKQTNKHGEGLFVCRGFRGWVGMGLGSTAISCVRMEGVPPSRQWLVPWSVVDGSMESLSEWVSATGKRLKKKLYTIFLPGVALPHPQFSTHTTPHCSYPFYIPQCLSRLQRKS